MRGFNDAEMVEEKKRRLPGLAEGASFEYVFGFRVQCDCGCQLSIRRRLGLCVARSLHT